MSWQIKSLWEYKTLLLLAKFLILQCVIAQFKSEETQPGKYSKPCSNYKPGEDDSQTFDFVRRYNLDVLGKHYSTKILKVKGTNSMQTAYRLDKEADVTIPTKDIFPFGLPDEFSLVITMRNNKFSKAPWYLMSIYNLKNDSEFGIVLNPKKQRIEFSVLDLKGTQQAISFYTPQIFNKNWHKIHFGIFTQNVVLYIDCNQVETRALNSRGFIDLSGNISLAKTINGNVTVPIDLQWMVLNCDPTRPERESCEEIPDNSALRKSVKECNNICSPIFNNTIGTSQVSEKGLKGEKGDAGPPGFEGPPGGPGLRGLPGDPGTKGDTGMPGPMGPPGPPCTLCYPDPSYSRGDKKVGLSGSPEYFVPIADLNFKGFVFEDQKSEAEGSSLRGPPGPRGEIGELGSEGPMGPPGNPGKDGVPGTPGRGGGTGFPGKSGEPGPQGPPGKVASQDEIRDICVRVWTEKISELMVMMEAPVNFVGKKSGRRGPPGPPGPPGNPGIPGERGPYGPPGEEGSPGMPGTDGPRGEKGEKGDTGNGLPGPVGFPGIQGPQGNDGRHGQPGRPGDRGEPGRPGQPGSHGQPGIAGPPGFCEFCNYPNVRSFNEKGP